MIIRVFVRTEKNIWSDEKMTIACIDDIQKMTKGLMDEIFKGEGAEKYYEIKTMPRDFKINTVNYPTGIDRDIGLKHKLRLEKKP